MLRLFSRRGLAAAVVSAGVLLGAPATAQQAADAVDECKGIWEAIGRPEATDDVGETPFEICHQGYVLGHGVKTRTPDWVMERLTRAIAKGKNKRPEIPFKAESGLPADIPGGTNEEYTGSGFDRGHQAPSNDFKSSVELMEDTFFYSNAVPQVGKGFNRGIWKDLEALVARLAINRGEIYIITGPVYQERRAIKVRASADACGAELSLEPLKENGVWKKAIGEVAIPAALYKILYDPDLGRLNAFLLPNLDHRDLQDTDRDLEYLERYRVGLGTVEKLTGLTFMTALDDRTRRMLKQECPATMLH